MKTCPYCAEDIQDEAVKCKHCGEWLSTKISSKPPENLFEDIDPDHSQQLSQLIKCRFCSHTISQTAITCPACGKNSEKDEQRNDDPDPVKSGLKAAAVATAVVLTGPAGILAASASLLADSYSNRSFKKIVRENAAIDSFYAGEYMVLVTQNEFILTYNMSGSGIYKKIPRNRIKEIFIDQRKTLSYSFFGSGKAVIAIKYSKFKDQNHDVEKFIKLTLKEKAASDLADHAINKFREYMI